MNAPVFSAVSRLATYLPLGSYVIYTALQTYSLSLGPTPAPATVVVAIPGGSNYSCYYMPESGVSVSYLDCTDDQSSALKISLAIGFFLAVFLSFLKHVPLDGRGPPLADPVISLPQPLPHPPPATEKPDAEQIELEDNVGGEPNAGRLADGGGGEGTAAGIGVGSRMSTIGVEGTPDGVRARSTRLGTTPTAAGVGLGEGEGGNGFQKWGYAQQQRHAYYYHALQQQQRRRPKYRRGILYVEGNSYYLDFGDFHIWGHAFLSFVAFGALSLCSASVSQCLFPTVKPWIFVFLQIILLVVCCFIAMFWINDPTLSLGLSIIKDPTTGGEPPRPPAPTPPPPPPPKPIHVDYPDGSYENTYPWQPRPPPTTAPTSFPSPTAFSTSTNNNMSTDSLAVSSNMMAKLAVSAKAVMVPSAASATLLSSQPPIASSNGSSGGGSGSISSSSRPFNVLPRSSSLMSEATAASSRSALSGHVYPAYDAAEMVAARRVVINMDPENGGGVITAGGQQQQ